MSYLKMKYLIKFTIFSFLISSSGYSFAFVKSPYLARLLADSTRKLDREAVHKQLIDGYDPFLGKENSAFIISVKLGFHSVRNKIFNYFPVRFDNCEGYQKEQLIIAISVIAKLNNYKIGILGDYLAYVGEIKNLNEHDINELTKVLNTAGREGKLEVVEPLLNFGVPPTDLMRFKPFKQNKKIGSLSQTWRWLNREVEKRRTNRFLFPLAHSEKLKEQTVHQLTPFSIVISTALDTILFFPQVVFTLVPGLILKKESWQARNQLKIISYVFIKRGLLLAPVRLPYSVESHGGFHNDKLYDLEQLEKKYQDFLRDLIKKEGQEYTTGDVESSIFDVSVKMNENKYFLDEMKFYNAVINRLNNVS